MHVSKLSFQILTVFATWQRICSILMSKCLHLRMATTCEEGKYFFNKSSACVTVIPESEKCANIGMNELEEWNRTIEEDLYFLDNNGRFCMNFT